MGTTGLGKNSPVILTLGKENYEALIDRHGQWVRWRVATKCPCATKGSPDIHCRICGGRGYTYSFQKNKIVTQTVMCVDSSGVIELDSEYESCNLKRVYDSNGNEYPNAEKQGLYLLLNSSELPIKGSYVTAVMTDAILHTVESADCEKIGAGYYRVKGLRSAKTNIEGLYHSVPGDIESIGKIIDANGVEYTAKELRQDTFYIEPTLDEDEEEIEIAEPLTVQNVSYLPPFLFVILSQNLKEADENLVQKLNGDAVLTFPWNCDVSNDDVITVLSGTYTQKDIVKKKDADYDVIEAYFVDEIVSCVGTEREYVPGTDFILCGANYIKWLCDDCPEDGENYSITYRVFPTYKVVQNIPQIRTSENQRMPKKAVIKLLSTYGEKTGINRQ